MSEFNYSFELYDFNEALSPYGTIETQPPSSAIITTNDFRTGEHFRTSADSSYALQLELEGRLLTIILDESGSMTWNDNSGDRYVYLKRLLTKLEDTYPGTITANLITFGGSLSKTNLFLAQSGEDFLTSEGLSFDQFMQSTFQDGVYDFAGVRIVRRTDRFPEHPADGVVVSEGIFEAAKDDELSQGQDYYYGVWSFNKDGHFSTGQFVQSAPYDRILPSGVNFATGTARILPGVKRDDNTILIYNFVEGSGGLIFDSSGSGNHASVGSEVVEDNFWAGDSASSSHIGSSSKHPVGVRFDGEFDIIETDISDNNQFTPSTLGITVNIWIFRYANTADEWVIGTSHMTATNSVGWVLGITADGNLGIAAGDVSAGLTSSTLDIPIKTWTMITATIEESGANYVFDLYKNGQFVETITIAFIVSDTQMLYTGAKPTDSGSPWTGVDYFGSLAQVSIHDVTRSNDYIQSLYNDELSIFEATNTSWSSEPPDNKQREVLLNWEVSDDYDYQGGSVRIVRKYQSTPAHSNDGDVVAEIDAEPGEFFYIDSYGFIHNETYYYKLFTINSIGNTCSRREARTIGVKIHKSVNSPPPIALEPVSDENIVLGNKKLLLQWNNASDSRWRGTKIYYHPDHFPTINVSSDMTFSSDGDLILDTQDVNKTSFAHRVLGTLQGSDVPLANGYLHYYTFVTYDELRRFSEPRFLTGIPSGLLSTIFDPEDVEDLHLEVLNPTTLSIQWENPTLKSERLELFFGEPALCFVSVKDIYGGNLDDITNLKLEVCTSFRTRSIRSRSYPLGNDSSNFTSTERRGGAEQPSSGYNFTENCNSPEEEAETVLSYATIESGLIKGLIAHTMDRDILARRERYTMNVRAQYVVKDPDSQSDEPLFAYYTPGSSVIFVHPIKIAILNKLNKTCDITCGADGKIRGFMACPCPTDDSTTNCQTTTFAGGYIGATQPYVVRVEVQYKGEALPDGTTVNVELFEHADENSDDFLKIKSTKTVIREGSYSTSSVLAEEINQQGYPTGGLVSKSIVDIEITHPTEPDYLDIYVSFEYVGFYVDAIHSFRFVGTLFISADITQPLDDGIEVAEQFATVWTIDPDYPKDPTRTLPVPDGTIVKWELTKEQFGKDRPFYSTEELPNVISGIYSTTISGVARNIFFGPVGEVEPHNIVKSCASGEPKHCCIGEEYTIKANVILGDESAFDGLIFSYICDEPDKFSNKRFLVNAAPGQPGPGEPHYITWADGEHLLHFQIARNPIAIESSSELDMLNVAEFNNCVNAVVGGENFSLSLEHIVTITAPGEILWDVVFVEDSLESGAAQSDAAGITDVPASYQSVSPQIAEQLGIPFAAHIPIRGEITDFYMRYNAFIGDDNNPKPSECHGQGGEVDILDCQYRNICDTDIGQKWDGVGTMHGVTTILVNNKPVTLLGGGDYEEGIPPIKVGWKEPLDVRVIEARLPNGEIARELIVDSSTRHTFVVEVKFAGTVVPDGTRIDLTVIESSGDAGIVRLSACAGVDEPCEPASNGIIYTRQVNDFRLNPGTLPVRSLAYFTIEPIADVAFNAKINVTCEYDKLGTADRKITKCVELNNTVNVSQPTTPPVDPESTPIETKASSNEAIVYDTIDDKYETVAAGQIDRLAHFAAAAITGTTDRIFLMGGFTSQELGATSRITPLCEEYDIARDEWSFMADMPTPRVAGQTAQKDGIIYCIGGLSQDPLLDSTYIVSRKLEAYDTTTGIWNDTLMDMPEGYGIAFGDAQIAGDYIYVVCGATSVINSIFPGDLNDRILRYSINDDSWSSISPSNPLLYQRLSPFGFNRLQVVEFSDSVGESNTYYVYGGSIPKTEEQIAAERNAIIDRLIDEFKVETFASPYYLNLDTSDQELFIKEGEQNIKDGVKVPAFIYPATGFKIYLADLEGDSPPNTISIADTLDDEWKVLPKPRDRGKAIYIPRQDVVYFIGGSNQDQSNTLNRVESIDFGNSNMYTRLTPLNRGRAMFAAVAVGDDIYFSGGLTSGHIPGWVKVEVTQNPSYVEALGEESAGILIKLKNDSGEIIDSDVRVAIRGIIHVPTIDSKIKQFLVNRGADRALGGTGAGDATDLPGEGDTIDIGRLIEAQNKITDPNSDEFQFNAARRLGEEIFLFPVLYSNSEIILKQGVGGVVLKPRSEDPLADFDKLADFVDTVLQNTPENTDERFEGDLTRDELAALGEVLATIDLPPTIITAGSVRDLYWIETRVTILDNQYFGETVSDFDTEVQTEINSRIEAKLTPPLAEEGEPQQDDISGIGIPTQSGGSVVTESECLLLQHLAQPQRDAVDTPPQQEPPSTPRRTGSVQNSGQCTWCAGLLPTAPDIDLAPKTVSAYYYNWVDWIPQVRKRFTDNTHSLSSITTAIDIIDHETPFGGSQLYNALFEAGRTMSGDTFDTLKKSIYICSDNSQNLSLITRREAIDEVNAIDGDVKVPIMYTVFSTSFPLSLSAMLERSEVGDIAKMTEETGGQSTTLTASSFLDQILNLTIGGATGGLGYGIYTRILTFAELTAITSMTTNFTLPSNTQGYVRLRYSSDAYNFGDWGERFEGNQFIDFVDFFAKVIEFEVVLSTGFSTDITEEYDSTPTGVPKLNSILWDTSGEREDFIYVDKEDILTNAQQVAVAFEGQVPTNAIIDVGVASSESHNWNDFHTSARPSVNEFGKIFMLERTDDPDSVVPIESLTTKDQQLYTSVYGPWDPQSVVQLLEVTADGDVPVLSGFVLYPREGQVYFKTRQNPTKSFKLAIVNSNELRVGIRLRNRLHTDSISVSGIGYIYSTNDEKPAELSQVAPRAISVSISPADPTSADTIFALYTYVDLNNDTEQGTIISWFKNGKQLFEIQNNTSWTNDDLLNTNKLEPNDKIHFAVTPSDGREFGATVYSPTASIAPQEPGAQNSVIVYTRDGVFNDRPDTGSRLTVQYSFFTDDTGSAAIENGTIVAWYVNGTKWKEGTYSKVEEDNLRAEWAAGVSSDSGRDFDAELDSVQSALYIVPGELQNGTLAHVISNQIYAEVTPRTITITGNTVRTNTITVVNSIPRVLSVTASPTSPNSQSTLLVSYTIDDPDFLQDQEDASEIRWYRSINGVDFTEVESVRDSTSVPPDQLITGDQWYVEISPFDGLDIGSPKSSNILTIQ